MKRLKAQALKEMVKALSEEDRKEILRLLLPGFDVDFQNLVHQVYHLSISIEAMYDINRLGLPFDEATFQIAVRNVEEFNPGLISGKVTVEDRYNSLSRILRR
jgi:hypothetical protein